jgi:hypothetical protein
MASCFACNAVSCPFSTCIAGSIESCNFKSGRFTRRSVKVGSR